MTSPVSHLVIAGVPKSANVYFQHAMEMTLGCTFVRFVDARQQIVPDKLDEFLALNRAVGGQHLWPTEHNLRQLTARSIRKLAILVRDPRDAIVSAWHHLERPDIKADASRLQVAVAAGAVSPSYRELGPEEKMRDLIVRLCPLFQDWISSWLEIADTSSMIECHISRFEDLVVDPPGAVRAMLTFFGHEIDPVLPEIRRGGGDRIQMATHFRRGQVGSFRDELSGELINLLDEIRDHSLAARMGWD